MTPSVNEIDPLVFRQTLSHYPTGVAVVAALGTDGEPVGLTVGSFTSVSLSPALVGFFPARSSTSWPRIAEMGNFAVSVLSDAQRDLSRALSSTKGKKFASVNWHLSANGSPILDGALIWLDCVMHAVHDAGDHELVLGRVLDFGVLSSEQPLLFHRGSYVSCTAPKISA